jgi:hypothetical protein
MDAAGRVKKWIRLPEIDDDFKIVTSNDGTSKGSV